MYIAAATRNELGTFQEHIREGRPPGMRLPVTGSRMQSPSLRTSPLPPLRPTSVTNGEVARPIRLTPAAALDELAARLALVAAPKEPLYRPRKPQLVAPGSKLLYDDRPMICSPAHARRAMRPSARGPGSVRVSMPTTEPMPYEELGLLAKPTNSSVVRNFETSRSFGSLASQRSLSNASFFGGCAYGSMSSASLRSVTSGPIMTPNAELARHGVPPPPHHGVYSRARRYLPMDPISPDGLGSASYASTASTPMDHVRQMQKVPDGVPKHLLIGIDGGGEFMFPVPHGDHP